MPSLSWRRVTWRAGGVGLGLVACWLLLLLVGSELFVLVHAFYLPVTLAAFWLGPVGAVASAVAAGVMAGPLLPAGVRPAEYAAGEWLVRLGFFAGFSVLAGILLSRIRSQARSMRSLYARTLRGFVRALEYKDVETGDHCERVARNAVHMGRQLGFAETQLEAIYWAGYLHDLGKIATPAEVLGKPGRLTSAEYEVVKKHAEMGADLLEGVSTSFRSIAEGVRHHHERWDGLGYPGGLAGEEIPLFGRILGVVDVFEALTSDRPYRAALPVREAAAIVQEGAGSHFDPGLAEAFLSLVAADRVHVQGRSGNESLVESPVMFNPEVLREQAWDKKRMLS
ncbi:MAG: HD-GYP domain-containing protein [Trueperaceae bacterium]|nr:HD-GYP domain-containing protein [Trueperaceae bacterium]